MPGAATGRDPATAGRRTIDDSDAAAAFPAEEGALALDRADALSSLRAELAVPPWLGGRYPTLAYMAGDSLGLMPLAARDAVVEELDAWAQLGQEGRFRGKHPWLPYHEAVRETSARLVGGST